MSARTRDAADDRPMRRLLLALNETGASGAPSGLDDGMIAVAAPRRGVTLALAKLPARAADRAAAEGLAAWVADGGARRLVLAEAGRAYLRRLAAPAEPFLAQHAPLARLSVERGAPAALVNEGESPLAWLARRRDRDGRPFLDRAQVEAGERLRRDIERAQILQRVTSNWEAPVSGAASAGGAAVPEMAMDARRRLARAFDAVGPDLSGLLTDVCGYLKRLETVESERGWPARSGKVVLRIALDRLARHYGLAAQATGAARSQGPLHWGAEDYRPSL